MVKIAWDLRVESAKNYVELVWLGAWVELVFMFHVKHAPPSRVII